MTRSLIPLNFSQSLAMRFSARACFEVGEWTDAAGNVEFHDMMAARAVRERGPRSAVPLRSEFGAQMVKEDLPMGDGVTRDCLKQKLKLS